MQKKSEHWLARLTACAYFDWPEWRRFWVSDVCCQMQKYWRAKKRLNVHVNKDSSNSLYSEDILLFLKLELIRSIFTSVKKRKNYKGGMLESLAFSNFWFSLYPNEATPKLTWHVNLFIPYNLYDFRLVSLLGSRRDILWSWAFPWSSFRRISLLSM